VFPSPLSSLSLPSKKWRVSNPKPASSASSSVHKGLPILVAFHNLQRKQPHRVCLQTRVNVLGAGMLIFGEPENNPLLGEARNNSAELLILLRCRNLRARSTLASTDDIFTERGLKI